MSQSPTPPYVKDQTKVTEIPHDGSPEDDPPIQHRPGWKPHTLRAPLLTAVVICLLCLIATLEYLSRVSEQRGALFTGCKGFSTGTTFVYLYMPTIFAVFLSLLWSWIDLDAKRLEPYFQMSKPKGAAPKDSLDLHYPFDFVAFAPVKAIRNRHWAVAASGSAMLVIFWVVTPLIGTIFATKDVEIRRHVVAHYRSSLSSPAQQVEELTNRFWSLAYDHIWADEPLPVFTTPTFTLLPFDFQSEIDDIPPNNATWSAPTKLYSTSLKCDKAELDVDKDQYSNGQGCVLSKEGMQFSLRDQIGLLYFGYWGSQYSTFSLDGQDDCRSRQNQHIFFGSMHNILNGRNDTTAIYCQPSYWQQDVNATVFRSNLSVDRVEPLGSRILLPDTLFNITNFEYVMNAQSPLVSKRADIIDTATFLDHTWRLQQSLGLNVSGYTPLVGVTLALSPLPLTAYFDLETAASAFQKSHQLLFTLALQSLLHNASNPTSLQAGVEKYVCPGVIVVRHFTIAVEVLLGTICLLACSLACIYHYRRSEMPGNPGSIGDILRLIDVHSVVDQELSISVDGGSCALVSLRDDKIRREHLGNLEGEKPARSHCRMKSANRPDGTLLQDQNEQSWEIRKLTGIGLISTILVVLVVLVTFYSLAGQRHGLQKPSNNDILNQLVTNYLPVAFATFLEPFWTLLNRILCVLRPFEALLSGDASVVQSVSLRYTSLPPQLAFWPALRAHDSILVAVCAIGLSANILAVAMSGLFTSQTIPVETTVSLEQRYSPKYNQVLNDSRWIGVADGDVFPITAYTLSHGAVLPPWVQDDQYFVPFELSANESRLGNDTYSGTTTGFGVTLDCRQVDYNATALVTSIPGPPLVDIGQGRMCANQLTGPQGGQHDTMMATEIFTPLFEPSTEFNKTDNGCTRMFLAGFLRANFSTSYDSFKTDNSATFDTVPKIKKINSLSSSWMVCEQRFQAAPCAVTVDQSGRINAATRSGAPYTDSMRIFSKNVNESYFYNRTRDISLYTRDMIPFWHNDSFVDSWFGYLVKVIDPQTIDPSGGIPDFSKMNVIVNAVWRRAYAVQLSMNPHWLLASDTTQLLPGTRTRYERRIGMSQPAFIVASVLLGLNIVVATVFYYRRPKMALFPRMPITVGRVMDLFDGSSLVEEEAILHRDLQVGYGVFMGQDSRMHVGIEKQSLLLRNRSMMEEQAS